MDKSAEEFIRFKEIIAKLRDPNGGCPWDLEQTHETLKSCLLEETYEVIEAIDTNQSKLPEELGDLLLQVILHSQIASEENRFDITDVLKGITTKIIARHPHVFGDVEAKTAEEVKKNWERIKKGELKEKQSVLDTVPEPLPALAKAQRMGEKAAALGFDWRNPDEVKSKIQEELKEFIETKSGSKEELEEFGDLLFALAQYARKIKINSEDALNQACRKFKTRFKYVEEKGGAKIKELPLEALEALWIESKGIAPK